MKEFESKLARFNSDLWSFHFMVPDEISKHFLENSQKRVICTINKLSTYQAALMPAGNGSYFINVNKEIRKKLNISEGRLVSIRLEEDTSEYGLPVPEEFLEWISQDPEGSELFHALTKGKQRSLLYIMGKPKRSETRMIKIMSVFEYLKSTSGKLDFRELYDFIKRYSRLNS